MNFGSSAIKLNNIQTYNSTSNTASNVFKKKFYSDYEDIDYNNYEEVNYENEIDIQKQIEKHKDDKAWWESLGDTLISTGATVVVGVTSVLSGALDLVECVVDGGAWVVSAVGSAIGLDTTGIKDFIARDLVTEGNDFLYGDGGILSAINDASYMKYDSEVAQGIRNVSTTVVEIAAATALTVATGGVAAPFVVGAVAGFGNAAESTYQENGTDTTLFQEVMIGGSGVLNGLSWMANGKLGQGFINIGKDVANAGIKDVASHFASDLLSKEFLKKALKNGLVSKNAIGNYISSAFMTGDDIIPYITGAKEFESKDVAFLALEYSKNLGLNLLEDVFRDSVSEYQSILGDTLSIKFKNKGINEISVKGLDLDSTGKIIPVNLIMQYITDPKMQAKLLNSSFADDLDGYTKAEIGEALNQLMYSAAKNNIDVDFSNDQLDAINLMISDSSLLAYSSYLNDILQGKQIISLPQNVLDDMFDSISISSLSDDDIKYLKQLIEFNNGKINFKSTDLLQQLVRKLEMGDYDKTIAQRLKNFAGSYVEDSKINSVLGSFIYKTSDEFAAEVSNPNWAAYNNGTNSVMNLKYSSDLLKLYANHESIHQISHSQINFDPMTGERISLAGVKRSVFDVNTQTWINSREGINESITELFNQLSLGDKYLPGHCGYEDAVSKLKQLVDLGVFSIDDLKKHYFSNSGDELMLLVDSFSQNINIGDISDELFTLFDKAISNDYTVRKEGLNGLNKLIKQIAIKVY